jgi:hypothetical protein
LALGCRWAEKGWLGYSIECVTVAAHESTLNRTPGVRSLVVYDTLFISLYYYTMGMGTYSCYAVGGA